MNEKLWLFNTMARRSRSGSDTFEENGLGIIESYLKARGHAVRVIDYATPATYRCLTPAPVARLTRKIYAKLFELRGGKSPLLACGLKLTALVLQRLLSKVQDRRMKKLLTSVARQVAAAQTPLFGMKLWYGEAFTWAKYLAGRIKELSPGTVIIAGGYHATLYEEDILRYSNFDLAVAGDGEESLLQLLKLVGEPWNRNVFLESAGRKIREGLIPGGIARDGEKVFRAERMVKGGIEEIERGKAIPVYRAGNGKAKVHILLESMGCPWNKCSFCVHSQFDKVYLKRNIDDLMNEIEVILKQGIALFRFTGSDTPPDFGGKIAEAILKRGFKIEFTMGTRAVKGSSNPEVAKKITDSYELLSRAGLKAVFMGGETGNDIINDKVMNKGINREDLVATIRAIRAAEARTGKHVNVSLALIYPTPLVDGVTTEQVFQDDIELIRQAGPDSVMITPPGPFKNSVWNQEKEKYGFRLGPDALQKAMEYEYVLYKPFDMWPALDMWLRDMPFKEILKVSQSLRNEIQDVLGIPTDLSDEHFLMMSAAGITGLNEIKQFKLNVMLDLVSCDYTYIERIAESVSRRSAELAGMNLFSLSNSPSEFEMCRIAPQPGRDSKPQKTIQVSGYESQGMVIRT